MANYQEINGVKIPLSAEGVWKLKKGDFIYAKFEVIEIKYDQNISIGEYNSKINKNNVQTSWKQKEPKT